MIRTIEWTSEGVRMIDQTRLPTEEVYPVFPTYEAVAEAIRSMVIRGAPAIGVAAAMGIARGLLDSTAKDAAGLVGDFGVIAGVLAGTRPTAVNLFWAVERMRRALEGMVADGLDPGEIRERMVGEALRVQQEDIESNRRMGEFGQTLMPDSGTVLTHCNAGALATAGHGTALGVIRSALERGKRLRVLADETRPFLQGARLTAWELWKDQIEVHVIADNMAGSLMRQGLVDAVIVGADRIARNGDVANKIGTYAVAVLARRHDIPFYVAAPVSTVDLSVASGSDIPIEERDPGEVTSFRGIRIAPEGVGALHPAFDITPAELVSAIITDRGIAHPPYGESLDRLSRTSS